MSPYSFKVFENAKIAPRASAIVYGIKHGFLPASAAADYEEWAITNLGIKGSDELLAVGDDKDAALKALAEAGYADDGTGRAIMRYAALASLKSQDKTLLDDIEAIYANFDYPSDMEPFIYYMPNESKNPSPETLVVKFNQFLSEEKERLGL